MKRLSMGFLALAMTVLLATGAFAADIKLADDGYAFHINGITYSQYDPIYYLPAPGLDTNLFDFVTGLGQITYVQTGGGASTVVSFFDIEIDREANTYYNEFGMVAGALPAGQSWEIDEPGYFYGNIFTNVTNGTLDNSNGVPPASYPPGDDVSMALGWNFTLAANQTATVVFYTSQAAPTAGFYLEQLDPDSDAAVFYWSSLNIVTKPIGVPEPVTMLLLGLGIIGAAGLKRKL